MVGTFGSAANSGFDWNGVADPTDWMILRGTWFTVVRRVRRLVAEQIRVVGERMSLPPSEVRPAPLLTLPVKGGWGV